MFPAASESPLVAGNTTPGAKTVCKRFGFVFSNDPQDKAGRSGTSWDIISKMARTIIITSYWRCCAIDDAIAQRAKRDLQIHSGKLKKNFDNPRG
jgi:hypothetical protein